MLASTSKIKRTCHRRVPRTLAIAALVYALLSLAYLLSPHSPLEWLVTAAWQRVYALGWGNEGAISVLHVPPLEMLRLRPHLHDDADASDAISSSITTSTVSPPPTSSDRMHAYARELCRRNGWHARRRPPRTPSAAAATDDNDDDDDDDGGLVRLYDAFTFHDELDLLTLRLRTLQDIVYRYVLVESTHTFSGARKPLHYAEHAGDTTLAPFRHRIIHVVFDAEVQTVTINTYDRQSRLTSSFVVDHPFPSESPSSPPATLSSVSAWTMQSHARSALVLGLTSHRVAAVSSSSSASTPAPTPTSTSAAPATPAAQQQRHHSVTARPHDLVLLSDLDELPRAAALLALTMCEASDDHHGDVDDDDDDAIVVDETASPIMTPDGNSASVKRPLTFPVTLHLQEYLYDFACRVKSDWHKAKVARIDQLQADCRSHALTRRVCPDSLRNAPQQVETLLGLPHASTLRLADAGWHLSYFLPIDRLISKIQAYAHTERNTAEARTSKFWRTQIAACRHVNGKDVGERFEIDDNNFATSPTTQASDEKRCERAMASLSSSSSPSSRMQRQLYRYTRIVCSQLATLPLHPFSDRHSAPWAAFFPKSSADSVADV